MTTQNPSFLYEVEGDQKKPAQEPEKGPQEHLNTKPLPNPSPEANSVNKAIKVKIHKKPGTDLEIDIEEDDDLGNRKETRQRSPKTCLLG